MTPAEAAEALTPSERLGFELAMARENMLDVFERTNVPDAEYEHKVCAYVNAFNSMYFSQDSTLEFATYEDVARRVKVEMEFMTRSPADCLLDVEASLVEYCKDERGEQLSAAGYGTLQRAVSLTLLDQIDKYRPVQASSR